MAGAVGGPSAGKWAKGKARLTLGDRSKKSYTLIKMKAEWQLLAGSVIAVTIAIAAMWLRFQHHIDGTAAVIVASSSSTFMSGMIIARSIKARKPN